MIDPEQNICVAYKINQPNFYIYQKKFEHGFLEIIDPQSREGCCGQSLASKDMYLISDDNFVFMNDVDTLK